MAALNMQQWDGSTKYATMGWQRICNDGMANNMQRWDDEEYATMGWRRICNDGMAKNMQRWDGKVSQSRAQSALNKHNDAIWLSNHSFSA